MLKNKIFAIFCLSLIITISAGCGGSADFSNATGDVSLAWDVPTTRVDGTQATGFIGFKLYYGNSSRVYTHIIDVKSVSTYTINSLPHGTYHFAITAYDSSGMESDFSPEIIKTI